MLPQVIPHLSKKASPEAGHALFRHKFWWQIELARLLRSHQSPADKQVHKQTMQRLRQQRAKSFNLLLALDHSLQFVRSGLGKFTTGWNEAPAPLKPCQERYEVPWVGPVDEECPANIQAAARKFVIEDTTTKDRWYELQVFPGGGSQHPCLAIVSDEGPDNMAASFFAMSGMRMRVIWTFDVLHRVINDMKLAMAACGLWPLLQELLHVLNLNHAPWQSKAFFKELQEAFQLFMENATPDNDIFQALVERLARDKGMPEQDTYDNAKCMHLMRSVASGRCWATVGTRCRWRVWCSVFQRLQEFLPDWNSTLLAITVLGKELGVWKDASQMPIWQTSGPELDLEQPAGTT